MNRAIKHGITIGIIAMIALLFISLVPTSQDEALNQKQQEETQETKDDPQGTPKNMSVSLSADKKNIIFDNKKILSIDHDTVFNWFVTSSGLCDEFNIQVVPRETFCSDKLFFRDQTRFVSAVASPDMAHIGFTIQSDILSPDAVVGIFSRSTNAVHLISSFYLGNEFISFSPSGTHFVYQYSCFEAMCGLQVRHSETLDRVADLVDSEYPDARSRAAVFIKWVSDNEIMYKLENPYNHESIITETKSISF